MYINTESVYRKVAKTNNNIYDQYKNQAFVYTKTVILILSYIIILTSINNLPKKYKTLYFFLCHSFLGRHIDKNLQETR